ncbi:hypothetical protein CF335_g3444 [Tilletia laevis]|nr:hypothetical protein CF335_g3444 [Tilletia laevis]
MKEENVAERTVKAWDKFNTRIRTHKDRNDPVVQMALQRLHHFQRNSFANTSRRTKNMKKKIEASGCSEKRKAKKLKKLRRFDPAKFPRKQLQSIITKQRAATLDLLNSKVSHSTPSNQQPLQSFRGGNPSTSSGSYPRPFPKPFRIIGSSGSSGPPGPIKCCALCGSKRPHDVRRCRAQHLAADPTKPTFTYRDENDSLVTRSGKPPAAHKSAPSSHPLRHPAALLLSPEGWDRHLDAANLRERYPSIVEALHHGLDIGIQPPSQTHISRHHKSATDHPTQVRLIIDKEITSHRYYGPLDTRSAVEELIGPFQTAPLGLRPKPNGKYRLIQDFSYPKTPKASHHPSINSSLDISLWPTTWYTFSNTCATILSLSRTAQAYVRDVTSAFRQIPLHPTQWAGTVVEWEGKFYIDQFLAFGLGPACGAFGLFADAFADICRANGIGPTGHWVDDNVFFRVPTASLPALNQHRAALCTKLQATPTRHRGRIYWRDSDQQLHAEDYAHDVLELPGAEQGFNCGVSDIDKISAALGWPWEREKDAPWASVFTYGGLTFNIATREVSLPDRKRQKYLDTISRWEQSGTQYRLHDAQQLLGQLQHATTVHTHGKFQIEKAQYDTGPSQFHQVGLTEPGPALPTSSRWPQNTQRPQMVEGSAGPGHLSLFV